MWDRLGEAGRAKVFEDYAGKVPAGHFGAVEELAGAALFAIGNPFVTGAVLTIGGGALLA